MMAARSALTQAPMLSCLLRGFAEVPAGADCAIRGVALDSRELIAGGLFLACRGRARHGLEFLADALGRGAAAVAWEPGEGPAPILPAGVAAVVVPQLGARASAIAGRFYDEPSAALEVVGITGTNGKSSVALMVAEALELAGRPAGVIGTLGAGRFGHLSTPGLTTPDAVGVQRRLAEFRDAGLAAAAMEVSSHGLDQGRVNGVHFRVAAFTNLTRDHLDYHGSERAYADAKARLFALPGLRAAVINLDDPFGRELLGRLEPAVAAIGYTLKGARPPAGTGCRVIGAERVRTGPGGIDVDVRGDAGRAQIRSPLVGRFNAANLLAVLGVLLALGRPFAEAAALLAKLHPAPGRMERFGGGDRPTVIVDYAHTPDALDNLLTAAREHAAGRVLAVFGCGGDRDCGKRPLMGAIAARGADACIVTDDNPRTEAPAAIVADIMAGVPAGAAVRVEHDRRRAIAAALKDAAAGDVVVVAGKGHEDYQIVGAERRPFDDRAVVRALLGNA